MKTYNSLTSRLLLIFILNFGILSCSKMNLEPYPGPSTSNYEKLVALDGVTAAVEPFLDEDLSEKYFGVNLLDRDIIALFFSVQNNTPKTSFLLLSKSIQIADIKKDKETNYNPSQASQDTGDAALLVGGASLIALPVLAPVILPVAFQNISDASVIKENFETKKIRTKTIDPGEKASGFIYYNLSELKKIRNPNLCFKLIDTIADDQKNYCLKVNVRN